MMVDVRADGEESENGDRVDGSVDVEELVESVVGVDPSELGIAVKGSALAID